MVIFITNLLSPKDNVIRKWSPVFKTWTQQYTSSKIKSQN